MSHTGAGSRPRREELGRRGDTPRRGLPTEPGRAGLPAPSASASPPPSPAARAQRRPAGLPLSPRRILPAPSSPAAGGGGRSVPQATTAGPASAAPGPHRTLPLRAPPGPLPLPPGATLPGRQGGGRAGALSMVGVSMATVRQRRLAAGRERGGLTAKWRRAVCGTRGLVFCLLAKTCPV